MTACAACLSSAALCTCTGHGPDLACVEHGEALRAWQKRNGT